MSGKKLKRPALGGGLAEKAARSLSGRGRSIDAAIEAASGTPKKPKKKRGIRQTGQ